MSCSATSDWQLKIGKRTTLGSSKILNPLGNALEKFRLSA
jgi:hypothetical protein